MVETYKDCIDQSIAINIELQREIYAFADFLFFRFLFVWALFERLFRSLDWGQM